MIRSWLSSFKKEGQYGILILVKSMIIYFYFWIRLHKDFDPIMYLCIEVVYDNYDYMIADVLHRIRLPDSHNLKRPKTTKSSQQEELKLVSKELHHFCHFMHGFSGGVKNWPIL